jgi:hypothetical protein
VFNYLDDPALTPILKALIEESASPLRAVETEFAVDASGFGTSRFVRWYDHKNGAEGRERVWLKAHLMVGVRTNIVTSVELTPGTQHDSPYLPQLVEATRGRFAVKEVSADKGYIGRKNLAAIAAVGDTPYIPFKSNTTGEGPDLWRRLYHYFMFNRDDFLAHYHKRSNAETAFSMFTGKFGGSLRSEGRRGAGQRIAVQGALPQPVRAGRGDLRTRRRADLLGGPGGSRSGLDEASSAGVDLVVGVNLHDVKCLVLAIADDARTLTKAPRQEPDVRRDVPGHRRDNPVSRDGFGPHSRSVRLHDLPPGQLA